MTPTDFRRQAILALLSAAVLLPARAAGSDADAIRHVMMQQFDQPQARLQVDPIVVQGQVAVAGWVQGERGGRALLARRGGSWHITLCAGDGLTRASMLMEAGIAQAQAQTLARDLAAAEARLPAAWRAKFSTFDGVMRMDAQGHHPPTPHR